jgi:hypothetical protein
VKNEITELNHTIKKILLVLFILSLASIFIALWIVAISIAKSPIPDFPFTMVEHMWKFFLVIPIQLTSVVCGYIYIRQGYKCKKNIIAGVIMIILLCVYGSFSSISQSKCSHDWNYLKGIEAIVDFDFPDDGDISVSFEHMGKGSSMAMVKIDQESSDAFVSTLKNNPNWKQDISFVPANAIDILTLTTTANYDYFSAFNITTNSYNNFPGNIIFMAFDVETNMIYISCKE